MRARTLAAVGLAAALGLAAMVPAGAASAPQVIDPVGDGNGANGQGFVNGGPAAPGTPANLTSLDIVSIQFATKFTGSGKKKTATDVVATMTMAGDIAQYGKSGVWRATAKVGGSCTFAFAYATYADSAAPSSSLRICDSSVVGYHDLTVKGVADGAKIVFTVPIKMLKSDGIKVGTVLDTLGGHTRAALGTSVSGGATVPQIDEATSDAVFKVGS
jgi:hypothetical protein